MSKLEKIYYEYQNNPDVGDCEAVKAARDSLYAYLDRKGLSVFEYEDIVGSVTSENEKQGFLNGFKYAMSIVMECMAKEVA